MKALKIAGFAALGLAATLCLSACASSASDDERAAASDPTMTTQISNPFVDCDTIDDAAEVAGFSMTVPESVDGYEGQYIQAIEGKLLQVAYSDSEHELLMRKAPGSEDISGDYNGYAQTTSAEVNGSTVTMKGPSEGIQMATWTDGEFSYAVDVTGAPLTVEAMTAIVEQIS